MKPFLRLSPYLALTLFGLALFYVLFQSRWSVENNSRKIITEIASEPEETVIQFMQPVRNSFGLMQEQLPERFPYLDPDSLEAMEHYLRPILHQTDLISAIRIADSDNNEFFITETENFYITRTVIQQSFEIVEVTLEFKSSGRRISYIDSTNYQPNEQTWYTGALDYSSPDQSFTGKAKKLFWTGDPGITVSRIRPGKNGRFSIVAYDVPLEAISDFTAHLKISENGQFFILGQKGQLIGLPRMARELAGDTLSKLLLKTPYEIGLEPINTFYGNFQRQSLDSAVFVQKYEGQRYWCRMEAIQVNPQGKIVFGVLVPEKDMLGIIQKGQRNIIITFLVGYLMLIWIFWMYRRTRLMNRFIRHQKKEIEAKNDELTVSIQYAHRIQKTILDAENRLKQSFPDSFLLARPRNIVGGDFLWYQTISVGGKDSPERLHLLAMVDCTGHGIPAAFLTLFCQAALNEALEKEKKPSPPMILKRLYQTLEESLSDSGELADSLDIALLALQEKSGVMEFSGVNSSVYVHPENEAPIYLQGERSLHTDRLGSHSFTSQKIELSKAAHIYLFSDGIKDQFGGASNKKFTSRRLKELCAQMAPLPIEEQQDLLKKTLEEWQGEQEQTDDIIFCGVRLPSTF